MDWTLSPFSHMLLWCGTKLKKLTSLPLTDATCIQKKPGFNQVWLSFNITSFPIHPTRIEPSNNLWNLATSTVTRDWQWKIVPVHATQTYMVIRGVALFIPNLEIGYRWVLNIKCQRLYSQKRTPVPTQQGYTDGKDVLEKRLLPVPGFEPPNRPTCS